MQIRWCQFLMLDLGSPKVVQFQEVFWMKNAKGVNIF